jgi:AcrR family transcriptional regulator
MTTTRLTRSERSAVTRRELLEAAERCFFATGYHGTTLDDIAEEAGYTKGAVYSTFKSKAGLFLALFDEVVQRRMRDIRDVLSHDDPAERLAALGRQPVEEANARFLLLSIEFWIMAAREPALLEQFSERYLDLRASIAELAPATEGTLPAESWSIITLALSNGLALERLIDPAGVPDDLMASVQARIRGG